ncbi:hypothetical protein BDW68DRAFT_193295 [Aspergillus falconensis]
MPTIPISSPCQPTSASVQNTATGTERTMMDEIELQLCLSIDSTPILTSTKESQKQKENPKRSSPRAQTQQLQILGAKRLAEKMGYDGDDDNEGAVEGSLNLDISLNPRDGDGDGDGITNSPGSGKGDGHLGYLQLPPRKKVRNLFAWDSESTCQAVSGGVTSAESDMSKDKDQDPSTATQTTGAFYPIPSSLPLPLEQPHHPLLEESGAYMPALLDSLQLLKHPHPHPDPPDRPRRSQRFEIYEDPDDMDIDGVGYFNVYLDSAWYLSPDENKENAEEDGNGNHHRHHRNLSQLRNQNQSHRQDT